MDSNMYAVMRFDWNADKDKYWGGDEVLGVAMSVEAANKFVENWKHDELTETLTETKRHTAANGRLWRFFDGERGKRMTLRIDAVPLI